MGDAQIYCSVKDILQLVAIEGEGRDMMRHIRSASQWIQQQLGMFIPVKESRVVTASGKNSILIGTALDILTVTEDGTAITDYDEDPYGGTWRKGPITHLVRQNNSTWTKDLTISSWWGLFFDARSLGISASQTENATTLEVTAGGIVSPGMVIDIGDEAELILAGDGGPGSPAATAATSKLNGAIDNSNDLITVDNGAEFHENEVIALEGEDILLVKRNGNLWSVRRGWNGTSKASHADECAIAVYRSYQVERGVNGTTAAAHTNAAISRFMPPEDVVYLCVQMSVLMAQKAGTMFGGRAGNAASGEAFYVNEFPSQQIEKVKQNYWLPYL